MKSSIKKINIIFILLILILIFLISCTYKKVYIYDKDNSITIYCNREIGAINKKVFGNNFLGYEHETKKAELGEGYSSSDFGEGLWDPRRKVLVQGVIDLAKKAGIASARFPGGCGTHLYNWKNTIGQKRKHFLYGTDEFLKTCDEIKAEPILTLSYFIGDETDAADLVEYLNAPDNGSNPNGGVDWAKERSKNGHRQPYKIKYFEIGNEVYHGNHKEIKKVTPEEYAYRYLKYYEKMKKIDPSIKIGVILDTTDWNEKVLKIVKDKLDFGIVHIYPNGGFKETEIENNSPETIFKRALAEPSRHLKADFKKELQLLKEQSGKKISLAVTEYNGGFAQERPVPYRHCLGTALLNAELLRIFMDPELNVLMANYWNFVNEYWGMIANRFDGTEKTLYNEYYKRPNFYVLELYNEHFGDTLLLTKTESGYYKVENNTIPYLSVNASIDKNKNKVYLMVINKNLEDSITANIELEDFKPSKTGYSWVLNGPSVDATNEQNHDSVKAKEHKFDIEGATFSFTFEPHSLTVIEISEYERQ